jgi:transcriptional regulator with PAS, ATPase and Fis domain
MMHTTHSAYSGAVDTHLIDDDARPTLRVRAVHVAVLDGPSKGATARIDRPLFIIGSGEGADLRIHDDTVSREHLRVSLREGGVHLRDEGSTNGTYVGAMKVQDVLLGASSQITLGGTTLALHVDAETTELALSEHSGFGGAIGVSHVMRHLFATLERVAPTDTSVLIEGESGVGKEVLAQALHAHSARADGPFVALDCGAIPPNLIESELFGHERGAFTGADRARIGAFEQAHGGTLFLDELGELSPDLQPKLLRALEAREIRPVGGQRTRRVDVRVIAATNKNLSDGMQRGTFRADLFYRLAVVRVAVPPLRDRPEDVVPLATAFLRRIPGHERAELPADFAAMLTSYRWPGNVRELRNVVERYVVLGMNDASLFEESLGCATGGDLSHLPYHEARRIALDHFDRAYFPAVLERAGHVISRAAQLAQVGRGSFHRMLNRMRKAA